MEKEKFKKYTEEIFNALNYHDENEALIDFAILSASSKYTEFYDECQKFENKYGKSFDDFEREVMKKVGTEKFEEEDDLMAWKFAKESMDYWKNRLEELKSALQSTT